MVIGADDRETGVCRCGGQVAAQLLRRMQAAVGTHNDRSGRGAGGAA
jgi:hypothetical protein